MQQMECDKSSLLKVDSFKLGCIWFTGGQFLPAELVTYTSKLKIKDLWAKQIFHYAWNKIIIFPGNDKESIYPSILLALFSKRGSFFPAIQLF